MSSFLNSRVLKFNVIDIAYKCHENTGWLGIWLFSSHCMFSHSLTPFFSLALLPKFPPNLYKWACLQVISLPPENEVMDSLCIQPQEFYKPGFVLQNSNSVTASGRAGSWKTLFSTKKYKANRTYARCYFMSGFS